jgi:hypothetical protein
LRSRAAKTDPLALQAVESPRPPNGGARVARVELDRSWTANTDGLDAVKSQLELVLMREGMRDEGSSDTELRFGGGSQLFRILGGWISPRRWYPRAVTISLRRDVGTTKVDVHARSGWGSAQWIPA